MVSQSIIIFLADNINRDVFKFITFGWCFSPKLRSNDKFDTNDAVADAATAASK